MQFWLFSCILLAILVIETLCDASSVAYRKENRFIRSEVPEIILGRKTRSPIIGLNFGLGTSSNGLFGSLQNGYGNNAGRGNQNTGLNLALGPLGNVNLDILGTGSQTGRLTPGGSQGGLPYTETSNMGYGIGTSYQGGTISGTSRGTNAVGGDSSFELTTVQPLTRLDNTPTGGCIIPAQPTGGSYEVGSCASPCSIHPGNRVPIGSYLTYTCNKGYVLNGNNMTFCYNNAWYMPPTCTKTCRALTSNSVNIVCQHHGNPVSCEIDVKPGTTATMACKHSYKIPLASDPAYRELTCLNDGSWDHPLIRCIPECGTPVSQGNTLIVSGFKAKLGVFPWHVGIYQKNSSDFYTQICAGSLISPSLVISAAHCFYNDVIQGLNNPREYAVAAGKYYRSYNWPEKYVQKSGIRSIEIAERYYGASGNFAEDISLLRLRKPFTLTTLVRPICIDWENSRERDVLQNGKIGKVVGWGKTAEGVPSTELQEINLPYVSFEQCMSVVPEEFRGYVTADKFCAGYLNGSSLCEGDSGGGLNFEIGGLWYLRGIVSVSPVSGNTCDNNFYTAFTNVGNFLEWIRARYVDED